MSATTNINSNTININDIIELVSSDMKSVDTIITDNLNSDVPLINELGAYIIQAGGKRLRPVALLLAAKATLPSASKLESKHYFLAAIIEFIHTATLLHDDVVDESAMRRGKETANEVWGNSASVLVGDYLYSRSFQMMVEIGDMRVMDILSHTTNQIAEGEVMQLLNCGAADTSEQQYFDTIQSKTAILFEAATKLGSVINNNDGATDDRLTKYGLHIGTAFQLVDDILDYTADAGTMGKNAGDDLAEGKPTLPIIHAIKTATGKDKKMLINAISNASIDNLDQVLEIMDKSGSIEYTRQAAFNQCELAKQALNDLDDNEYTNALIALADFSIKRAY